jgi:putative acetyltransferase
MGQPVSGVLPDTGSRSRVDAVTIRASSGQTALPHRSSFETRSRLRLRRARDADAVFVVGHPAYYPRFGFRPASAHGVQCEFEVADDGFMAVELRPSALSVQRGVLRYPKPFHQMH